MHEPQNPRRRVPAIALCYASKGLVTFMAIVTGIALTVAIIVLAVEGTISVIAAIGIWIFGLPLAEFVVKWLTVVAAVALTMLARLLDRELTEEWLDSQPEYYE